MGTLIGESQNLFFVLCFLFFSWFIWHWCLRCAVVLGGLPPENGGDCRSTMSEEAHPLSDYYAPCSPTWKPSGALYPFFWFNVPL